MSSDNSNSNCNSSSNSISNNSSNSSTIYDYNEIMPCVYASSNYMYLSGM